MVLASTILCSWPPDRPKPCVTGSYPISDFGVQAFLLAGHEVERLCVFEGCETLEGEVLGDEAFVELVFVCDGDELQQQLVVAHEDVDQQRVHEQLRVLRDVGGVRQELGHVVGRVVDVHAVDQHAAAGRLQEADCQVQEGRLSVAARTDQAVDLASDELAAQVLEDVVGVFAVPEADVLELHVEHLRVQLLRHQLLHSMDLSVVGQLAEQRLVGLRLDG